MSNYLPVTFKKKIIPHLDVLSGDALRTQSVNTVCLNNGNVTGHNTDIDGFELSIERLNYDVSNKKIVILGGAFIMFWKIKNRKLHYKINVFPG